jgi:hypothetical protein
VINWGLCEVKLIRWECAECNDKAPKWVGS